MTPSLREALAALAQEWTMQGHLGRPHGRGKALAAKELLAALAAPEEGRAERIEKAARALIAGVENVMGGNLLAAPSIPTLRQQLRDALRAAPASPEPRPLEEQFRPGLANNPHGWAPPLASPEPEGERGPSMDEVVRQVVKILCQEGLTAAATVLNVTWSRERAARPASPPSPAPRIGQKPPLTAERIEAALREGQAAVDACAPLMPGPPGTFHTPSPAPEAARDCRSCLFRIVFETKRADEPTVTGCRAKGYEGYVANDDNPPCGGIMYVRAPAPSPAADAAKGRP